MDPPCPPLVPSLITKETSNVSSIKTGFEYVGISHMSNFTVVSKCSEDAMFALCIIYFLISFFILIDNFCNPGLKQNMFIPRFDTYILFLF